MNVIKSARDYTGRPCAAAMGMFDGLHIGHRELIRLTGQAASELNAPLVVVTYARHPLYTLRPEIAPQPLLTNEERLAVFEQLGVDTVVMNEFDRTMAGTEPEDFLRTLCAGLHPLLLAAGNNHSFGKKARGNAELLMSMQEELAYRALIVKPVALNGQPVSSSRIRALLKEGSVDEAERLMGKRMTI